MSVRAFSLPAVLVFLSGAASLIYEVVWLQRASLTVGASYQAAATLLAVFLLGVSAGSALFGVCSRNAQRPLLWCAAIEAALSLFGVAYVPLFTAADALYAGLYGLVAGDATRVLLLRTAVSIVFLLPPTMLMGGTLPLYCRRWLGRKAPMAGFGTLYAINTMGAAFGCALAGFVLLPDWGANASSHIGAALNLCAALGFFALAAVDRCKHTPRLTEHVELASAEHKHTPSLAERMAAGVLAFTTGAAGMLNELVWMRLLASVIRNTVYTYTISITVVLCGSALGAWLAGPWFDTFAQRHTRYAWLSILLAVYALAVSAVLGLPATIWWTLAGVGPVMLFLPLLPAATLSGAVFTCMNRTAMTRPTRASDTVGRINAVTLIGGVLGAVCGGVWLLPAWGLQQTGYFSAVLLAAAAVISWTACLGLTGAPGSAPVERKAWLFVITASATGLILWVMPQASLPKDLLTNQGRVDALVEGTNSTLAAIIQGDDKAMYMNQAWQGVAGRSHQAFAAHIPMLYAQHARNVLVVGLGAGQAAGRFLYHDIQALDIVDIEPALPEFLRAHFPSAWMADPRVRLLTDDGRSFLAHTDRRYDILSLELGQPYLPGVDKFYTHEFYTTARTRLTQGGLIAQFVPLSLLPGREFASVIKTFMTVFPHAALWYNTSELLLLGSATPLPALDANAFRRLLRSPQIAADMTFAYWGGERYRLSDFAVLAGGLLAEGLHLQALVEAEGGIVLTDDDSRLAYVASRVHSADLLARHNADVLKQHLIPLHRVLVPASVHGMDVQRAEQVRRLNLGDVAAAARLDAMYEDPGAAYDAVTQLQSALQDNPAAVRVLRLLVSGLVLAGRQTEALVYARQLAEVDPEEPWARQQVLDLERRTGSRQ